MASFGEEIDVRVVVRCGTGKEETTVFSGEFVDVVEGKMGKGKRVYFLFL